jgi:hypothetical integral membrane protein (TIGR02206 family)
MDRFQAFTLLHGLAVAGVAALTMTAVRLPRSGPGGERALRMAGGAFVATWFAVHGWWLLPPRLDPATTLPLQLCHLTALAAGLYFARDIVALRPLLYFWGFGLCTQALLTPTLEEGPATHVFWYFWLSHGVIIAAAVHALAVGKYRPTWRDACLALGAVVIYGALMLPVNLVLGANYGFVGATKPQQPTLVDALGPWPGRLALIVLLVAAVMALLMLPWVRPRLRAAEQEGAE